ncbi:MAG TPA: protein kinase [Longimicrobiales bacterium]|nr:protein kinase [Longimicrobiales bacterium]
MPLSDGARLGPYEILSALGAGGMGEVYRARDTRLDRKVAIKILPHAFVVDAERVARFQREAKVLASLNHPHIAAIYGLDEADGVRALVMELVEGEDLAHRLTRGPIPLDEALAIARQIAEALEVAHEQGIIHRDIKPANIKLRPDGTVKVLDFGLAKAVVGGGEMPDLPDSPTVTAVATRVGTVLGTASYMSPEQARGRPVDRRTDLWAFGVVLYELLTGTRAFQGESVAETLAHVLTLTPNWALLPAETPAPIRTLLRRCVEKNPARRLDSAVALRLEIDDTLTALAGVTTTDDPEAPRRRIAWPAIAAIAGASLISALGTWAVLWNNPPAPALPARFTITFPPTEPMELSGRGRDIALSPDGRYLAYQSRGRLMLRAFDELDAVPLSSVTGGRTPFFSPDSRWIGFFDGGDLKKVAVTGEPVITLLRELGSPEGGTWGDDGSIIISSEDDNIGLMRVSADGGEATALTRTDAAPRGHKTPSLLPGGRGVLFTISGNAPEDRQLAVLDLKSGQQKTLLRGGIAAEYLDTGHLVYATVGSQGSNALGTLWVVAFDLGRLELRGEPVRVSETLQIDILSAANYAVSRTGVLAYVPAPARTRSFVWVDRKGQETAIRALPPRPYSTMALSPDGTRLAFAIEDGEFDIWTWDFARESLTRLTFGPSFDFLPKWTPDGRRIVFQSNRAGSPNIFSVAADGSGPVERLTTSNNDQYPNSITPDGTALLFCELRPKTGFDILRLPIVAEPRGAGSATLSDERRSEPTALVSTPSAEYAANISPDGRYFAYQSAESGGRFAIYVRPYPDAAQGRWQISTEGGSAPVWARTGRELFYLDESNTLMVVPIQTSGPHFSAGRPAKVLDTKYSGAFYSYDVTPDGLRFLMMKESTAGAREHPPSMVVVLNWFEELRRRVPTQ